MTGKEEEEKKKVQVTEQKATTTEQEKTGTNSIEVKKEEEEKLKPKEYTQEEIDMIAKKVEIPTDNTPAYAPRNILSQEFKGTSNYEIGMDNIKKNAQEKLENLKKIPNDSTTKQIKQTEHVLRVIDYLYENYHLGMNVFRTAKGGRNKLRE